MKKLIALLLALMCVFALAACGETDTSETTPTPTLDDTQDETTPTPTLDDTQVETPDGDSDLAYITGENELVVGITIYEPMNYYDGNELTGFDTEFAKLICEKLGVTANFVEINWDTKEVELAAGTIDCIWNGMTITPSRAEEMSISYPYVKNAQVIVVKADSGITSTADLIGKTVVAELGSAGEAQVTGEDANEDLLQAQYIGMSKQTDCLMEVKAGTADAAVLDWTLAKSMVGAGTDYSDLIMVEGVELASEEYGIAFRKGSDVTETVNGYILELVADGTLPALAEKYGLSLAPAISE